MSLKISLTGEQFGKLVRGKIVQFKLSRELGEQVIIPLSDEDVPENTHIIEISLQDIGFGIMRNHIDEAQKQ